VVNLAAAWVLANGRRDNLNVEATFRHVLADLAGSVGVIVAAILVLTRGWTLADPIISIVVGLLVLFGSWHLLKVATRVLLEAAPEGIDVQAVGQRLAGVPGIVQVHDLHIWTITSGFPALSAHVLVGPDEDCHARCRELEEILAREFGISHATLKVDHRSEQGKFVPLEQIGRR
jgi:cobalt-zinc-cadmium efflux system protein